MAGTRLTYVYTSQAEIERIFSLKGVELRMSDLSELNQAELWLELTEAATDIIDSYCLHFYDGSVLVNSRWVRMRATWIGCYLLSQRKGNPALFLQQYQDVLTDLERVRDGLIFIPHLPTTSDLTPRMTNMTIDLRHPLQIARAIDATSVGPTDQNLTYAYRYPFDWL